MRFNSSPIVGMNYAAAVAMSEGLEKGLALLEQVGSLGRLENYYVFHAAQADLLRRLNRRQEAATTYLRALHSRQIRWSSDTSNGVYGKSKKK